MKMDEIEELLPGLEEFLTITLSSESLSKFAEERRQYFIERLDIVKLPPTVPPREGRVLAPELLKKTEEESGTPASHTVSDFAATQREISRSYVDSQPRHEDVTDSAETSSVQGVKVYDDIETDESKPQENTRPSSSGQSNDVSDEENEDVQDNALYEIPMARHHESNSTSYAADGSSNATAGSTEELTDEVLDGSQSATAVAPPPLPPRRDIKFSDSGSRNSINFDDQPPELPFRPPLPKRNELQPQDKSDRSANSDHEGSGDGDSTSYESFDEGERRKTEQVNKLNIQLPKKLKKKVALKKSKNLSKSRSSSQWEITVPFRKLENIEISGELYYKGKLKWNRRIVAISNGCLAMYKPDKDARPSLVVPLIGYEASVNEREGRKGFEVKMVHPNTDSLSFSVDFKDWALLWVEHINGNARGQPPTKFHTHLARTFSPDIDSSYSTNSHGSKLKKNEDRSMDLEYDEIGCGGGGEAMDDIFIKEEGEDCDSIKSSPVETLSEWRSKTLVPRQFQSEKSPRHSKSRTLTHSKKGNPFGLSSRDRTIGATVKDILRRRQRAVYNFHNPEPCVQVERYTLQGDRSSNQVEQVDQLGQSPENSASSTSELSVSSWDWKSVFYGWSTPLDQLILALRATDLAGSNSNVSTGSEGGSEDSSKSKIRSNKVMRMGSFAFRATQFFENIGKKTIQKRKPHQSSTSNLRHSGSDYPDVRSGIIEESPAPILSSTGNLARNRGRHISDSNLPSFTFDNFSSSTTQASAEGDGFTCDEKHWGEDNYDNNDNDFVDVTHKGYLSVFSSFSRRRWGRRWCLVRENTFECYRTDYSKQCELSFLLRPCLLRRATGETNSENGLMIVEAGKEKITVEPLSREDMGRWVQVLMNETSTPAVPEGLEEFLKELENVEGDGASIMSFSVLKQWDMDCLVPGKSSFSHDYEDPLDAVGASAKHEVTEPHSSTNISQISPTSENAMNKSNNLSMYSKHKHTTDSGFYSARGTNSDSDSSCGNGPYDISEIDCGYAAQDSSLLCSQNLPTPSACPSLLEEHLLHDNSVHKQASSDHHHSSFSQPFLISTSPSSSRNMESSSSESLPNDTSAFLQGGYDFSSVHGASVEDDGSSEPHTPQARSPCPSDSSSATLGRSGSSMTPHQVLLSSGGEEYAVVLKRSQQSSKYSDTSCDLNNSASSTLKSRTDLKLEDDVFEESSEDVGDVNNLSSGYTDSNTDNDSSFYEPICSPTNITITSSLATSEINKLETSQCHVMEISCGDVKSTHYNDVTRTSCDNVMDTLCDSADHPPPPVPTSPVPDLADSPLSSQISPPSPSHSAHQQAGISSSYSQSVTSECSAPSTSNDVLEAIKHSTTSLDELNNLMEQLKNKQSEIKKKRIVSHDRRQKATNDEERLACEREIASLDKVGESLNTDMRIVQNQLDVAQGKTLEAAKTYKGKQASSSKKRKTKKKP